MEKKFLIQKESLLDLFLLVISWLVLALYNNRFSISIIILFFSALMLYKVRGNSYLMILFGVILYINISMVISEVLGLMTPLGQETISWQNSVRKSNNWLIGANSLAVMVSTLNLFINKKLLEVEVRDYKLNIKDNPIVFFTGYAFLWFIYVFFSYSAGGTNGGYISNTNPLYEYCIIICPVVWMYSNNEKSKKILMAVFVGAYCIKAYMHGDRSSMIPMFLFLFYIIFDNLNLKIRHVVLLAVIGIVSSNIINIIRIYSFTNIADLKSIYFIKYGASALTSDTVAQSYYTSVVVHLTKIDIGSGAKYFFDFLGAIVFGGGFKNGDVNGIVSQHYTNKWGGFFYSWPYFWFGIIGVIVFSVILGLIISRVFRSSTTYSNMLKLCIVLFSFRWYLYTCFDFFRGVLFVGTVVYFAFYVLDSVTKGNRYTRKMFQNE